jgi:predicted metal-dependent phosphoesterase TrpH
MTAGVTKAGIAGAIIVAAGLVTASSANPVPAPVVRTFGDERILAVDLHVHAQPGDGALLPWDLAREARRRGLDAIAITNHNQMIGVYHTRPLDTPFGVLLIPGEEVTTPYVHIAAIGLNHAVDWRGTIPEIAAAIHAQGGVAIAAHPAEAQRAPWTDEAFRAVDGVEAAHPIMFSGRRARAEIASAYAQAVAAHAGIAAIGSSDDHTAEPLGFCRTYVFTRTFTQDGILDAIRRGRTVACDAAGTTHGPADLVPVVRDACRADIRASQRTPARARAATGVVWAGLLVLAFFGFA